jgi:D-alanyl-lipoteichoic acid acyltransferase DltB (MBOAT superfamily)
MASYFFYACWDYRFLFLLIFSTLLDYYTGLKIHDSKTTSQKKFWLWLSICVNIGFLGFFKYYNFFIRSFADGLSFFGVHSNFWTLNIILPVGISFYTFHGLSYVLDIYNEKIIPVKNFIEYSVFVSFFPLLVAGPIERATHLLPQIQRERFFNYSKAVDGLRQILWGLFKKMAIADNCGVFADKIFDHQMDYSGSTLFLGAVLFAFQIYCDFSGYSDIALGTSRLLGIELLRNFAFPYFSRDIAEFWRRWHISLSSWFRDYVYIPLGGSRGGAWMKIRNTFAIFLLSGFWHGANWTFIAWGALNAIYFLPLLLLNKNRNNLEIVAKEDPFLSLKDFLKIIFTFCLTVFAWIFFRSKNLTDAFAFIKNMFCGLAQKASYVETISFIHQIGFVIPLLLLFFIMIEWRGRKQQYAIAGIGIEWPRYIRWAFYYGILLVTFNFAGLQQKFIYFQF